MDLTPYTQSLRDDLITAASVGDEDARRAAVMLAGAIEPAARLAIMTALSDLAAEVTGALRDTTVELKLDGRDVRVAVTEHVAPEPVGPRPDVLRKPAGPDSAAPDAAGPDGAGDSPEDLKRAVQDASGELSRTTVRLFNELKSQAERAAAEQGVSLNTYISRAVSDSVRSAVPGKNPRGRGGSGHDRTVTGYIRG
ncbi:toxin-antitoxin system HicB family antitoxin [Nakamurella sp.]|uniref:toxin-antitoxin system HicB family antitoxin n=1 Tax=Nakamurella sp. TaxID=1869182 RepID=UPI003B3AFEA9